MKYTYVYKSSDGVRHQDVIEAASRDEAFASLRKRNIKPIKVVAADGSKANGEVRGLRRRVAAAIAVVAAIVAGGVAFYIGSHSPSAVRNGLAQSGIAPRHQIYGDPVIMENFERGHFAGALTNQVDCMLAWFAQPGRLMCPKGVDPRRKHAEFAMCFTNRDLAATAPLHDKPAQASLSREAIELRQIVAGMRLELKNYLANGNGTPHSYWRRLLERTTQEMQIYERTRRELENETRPEVWEQKNDSLRRIGLRTIPNPNEDKE